MTNRDKFVEDAMYRRLNREDLQGSSPLTRGENPIPEFSWSVYDSYELVEQADEKLRYYKVPRDANVRNSYKPLVDTPHLFLEFARLSEAPNVDEAIHSWLGRRGLLGLHSREMNLGLGYEDSDRGGPIENLFYLQEETRKANKVLTWYEATLSSDEKKMEQTLGLEGNSRVNFDSRDEYLDTLAEYAMRVVVDEVERIVARWVRPCFGSLTAPGQGMPSRWWTPDSLTRSWWPGNLLGAMYLQMYWLMTSGGDLARCEYCGQIISLAQPHPEGRKRRRDKRFCDDACRQAHHRSKKGS